MILSLLGCGPQKLDVFSSYWEIEQQVTNVATGLDDYLQCDALESTESGNRLTFEVDYENKLQCDKDCIAYCDSWNQIIVLDEWLTEEYAEHTERLVLTHEIGHAFGLDHTPGTIMQAELMNMTEEDAYKSLGDLLNKKQLNPCKKN